MILALILLLIALSLGDVLTTRAILARSGGRELIPTTRWLIDKLGTLPGLLAGKLFWIALPLLLVARFWPDDLRACLIGLCVLTALILAWNTRQLLN